MEAYSTLVSVDIEAAVKLSAFIAELCPEESKEEYFKECNKLIEEARSCELLMKFLDKCNILIASDDEVEAVFQGMVSILFTIENAEQSSRVTSRLLEELAANTDNARLRLRVLVSLLNLFISPVDKFSTLQALLTYAMTSKQEAAVSHLSSSVEQWAVDWNMSSEQQLVIYSAMALVLAGAKQPSKSLAFSLKALKTSSSPSVSDLSSILIAALQLAPSEASLRCEVLAAAADKSHLAKDNAVAPLLALLRCVAEGDVAAYKSLAVDSLVSSAGVNAVALKRTLLFMSLCRAVSTQSKKGAVCVVSYETAATALEVSGNNADELVESWVVDAVGAGVLEGSLNQVDRCINVTRCVQPAFSKKQWQELADNLTVWKSSALAVQAALSRQEGI